MGFFAVPYDIHFDDTMAYGSHHFLTNFKFQCAGREHLLFGPHVFDDAAVRADFDQLLLLTYEGYSRNLAPAVLGDRLVVLMTVEERGEISARFCFRTLKRDGTPVACGYQTVLCADKATGQLCPFPETFRRCFDAMPGLQEEAAPQTFRDRALRGGGAVNGLFSEPIRNLARGLLAERGTLGVARLVELPSAAPKLPAQATAFLFAGQGTFDPGLFVRLKALQPDLRGELTAVAETCQAHGIDLAPLLVAEDVASVERALAETPKLDQLGIFLSGVLGARLLQQQGTRPDVFVGHSFGEIAAMTAAGALDLRGGAEVVCRRIRALEVVPDGRGTLAAVSLGEAETLSALEDCRVPNLQIAGVNHPRQTVVAGPRAELEQLRVLLEGRGQGLTFVPSRYPFHHQDLAPAAHAFRSSLADVKVHPAKGPLYSPIERRFYGGGHAELTDALTNHLVRPFDFPGTVETLVRAGCVRFVDCGTDGRMARIVQRNLAVGSKVEVTSIGASLPAEAPAPVAQVSADDPDTTVAIVSLGCVLPGGAKDPETYWQNIRSGVSGIVDLGALHPEQRTDFAGPAGTPDRTYSLLAGRVNEQDLVVPRGLAPARFDGYVREQKLLAIALSQAMAGLEPTAARARGRIQCLLGSTGDGSAEYDEAICIEAGEALLRAQGAHEGELTALGRVARKVVGVAARSEDLAPHATLQAVVADVVGQGASTVLLDAACASSLYAIALGMKALERREADLILAGGVFSPGAGNSCLFAQFNGLSAKGSRPFDEGADGVIFGEAAGVVGLMRLPDALAAGLPVRAVIRGAGLSSDGRSSSASVPRSDGQVAAMEACYAAAQVDPASIQYLEAHGTATPVGDATELKSIARVFGGKRSSLQLASVKALLGHTGWAAGAASVIKLCKAFEHRLFPKQSNFERPGAELRAIGPGFEVLTREQPWPENGEHPRRAATSGFGFGGTNAHLVLEEYRGVTPSRRPSAPSAQGLVVVAAEGLFPDARGAAVAGAPAEVGVRFDLDALRLPAKTRLLPDIAEDMDPTQRLALIAASALAQKLRGLDALRAGTAVVLSLEGKTHRGVQASQRVLVGSTRRKVHEAAQRAPELAHVLPLADRMHDAVLAALRPSGPYTLQGMMPNVTPGRVASGLDLKGPNFVVDAGAASLAASLRAAQLLLESGNELVLVGSTHVRRPGESAGAFLPAEGVALLAVTTEEKAAQRGLTPLCRLNLSPQQRDGTEPHVELPAHSAGEGLEVLRAVTVASEGRATTLRFHPDAATGTRLEVQLAPFTQAQAAVSPESPIRYHAPVLVERPVRTPSASRLRGRRVLFLAQDEALARELAREAESLCGPEHRILFAGSGGDGRRLHGIDLSKEEPAVVAIDALYFEPQVLLAVSRMEPGEGESQTVAATTLRHPALELLFLAARRAYDRLGAGEVELASLCIGGVGPRRVLHPVTGLFAGLLKSIGREVPARNVRAISTTPLPLREALDLVAAELGSEDGGEPSIEVCFDGPVRCVRRLRPTEVVTDPTPAPLLSAQSVVLLTGGGRGVTAVLAGALLKRYGCKVVLVGRSDPAEAPARILHATDAQLPDVEREFYAAAVVQQRGVAMPELRRQFERHLAARELRLTLDGLSRLPGKVSYRAADVTRAEDVERVIRELATEHGRLDLVVHGAGTQTSKRLNRRRLDELRTNLGTKLHGLRNLHQSCAARFGRPVPFHVLTSAFSFIGNDGQADYGAANEALDRLCAWVSDSRATAPWCSVGWLAWDGIGMTRGSEYRVLKEARQLRGIGAEEGEALFLQLLAGRPRQSINVQLTERERAFYGLEVLPPESPPPSPQLPVRHELVVDATSVPCLDDHRVRGTPTLPGAWALDLMLESALGADRPELRTVTIEDAKFSRFIRVKPGGRQSLRAECTTLVDEPGRRAVQVRLLGDIVHPSGQVLQRDLVHAEARFTLTAEPPRGTPQLEAAIPSSGGPTVRDPYCAAGAGIELGRMFDCLEEIRIDRTARFAQLGLPEALEQAGRAVPALLLDAAWRLSAMHAQGISSDVFAPIHLQRATFDRGLVESDGGPPRRLSLKALTPRVEGDVIQCGTVAAIDEAGRYRMLIEGCVARLMS